MPTVFFETFGCQMNVADSSAIGQALAHRGFVTAPDHKHADLIIVNTCSVRENAEKRALTRIRHFTQHKKHHAPHQSIWVTGCMAQRMGNSLKEQLPGIDQVVGAKAVPFIERELDALCAHIVALCDITTPTEQNAISVFVPVMRGCDNYCTYCIVPYVRGHEMSIPAIDIIDVIKRYVDNGAKEITLLGQNVNSYSHNHMDFADLLCMVHEVPGVKRIRFMTSHPKDCSERLIGAVASLSRLCKHIHLPVQSGSSRILERMNRRYTRESYDGLVQRIQATVSGVDLTTDVMVGFPGETEDDFLQTMSLFEKTRFTNAFMFAYSPREGTKAYDMPDDVPADIKSERLRVLVELQTGITKEHFAAMVGKSVEVLFRQRQDGRGKAWMGPDNGCKNVLLSCDADLAGTILPVRIVRSTGKTLIGQLDG